MSNTNRDYAIVYDIKNSSLVLSRPLVFYITDKNTSNIFVRLVTKKNIGDGIDQYTDIENASGYILLMRAIKPNDEVINIKATQHELESIFEFDLTEGFKDIPGTYICELMISTMVNGRQELITSDSFTYEVKRSVLSRIGEIIEHEDTTVEKLLNDLDALQGQINNLVVNGNGNSNPEVVQARSNFKGIRFGTLTERNLFVENSLDGDSFTISCTWEEGGINGNTGTDTPVSGYLRTVGYLVFNSLDRVKVTIKNCKLYVVKYTDNMNFIEASFMTDSFVISDTNSNYRFVIVPTDSSIQLIPSNFITITGSYCFKEIRNIKTEIQDIKFNNLAYDEVFRLSDKYIGGLSHKERLNWEIGGINGSTGGNVDINYAIRSDFFNIENKLEVFSEKDIYAITYNADGTYHSRINNVNHIINLTDNTKKYRLVLNFGYDSGITITDPNSMLDYISIKSEEVFAQNVLAVVDSPLKGKKINCLGDSITSIDYTRPNWWEMIAAKTGAIFNNYGISGTCIGYNEQREHNNGKCFCNRYMDMDVTADAVVVMGGTNDYEIKLGQWDDTTNESFFGALNVLMKGLLETYKGKPIIFMTPIQPSNDYETNIIDPLSAIKNGSNSSVSVQLRAEAIKRKCMQYGITCIDLFNNSGINGADSSKIYYRPNDTLHPSAYGQKIIANNLLPVLKNKFGL